MTDDPAIRRLLDDLDSSYLPTRLKAVRELAQVRASSAAIVEGLERVAMSASPMDVRLAALEALQKPAHRRAQWERLQAREGSLPVEALRDEIDQWRADGLISNLAADLLKERYPLAAPPEAAPEPPPVETPAAETPEPAAETTQTEPASAGTEPASAGTARAPRPTLSQILLGETAIRVALYLGAFFVVAAAFIIAALVELARLPILSVTTVVLLVASWMLARRLPTAGFVLFIAGGLMIPIDAGVLIDLSKMVAPQSFGLWAAALAIGGVVWAAGAWRYDSPLLAWAAFISIDLAALDLVQAQPNADANLYFLALTLAGLGGALAAWSLRRRRKPRYFVPLFATAQVQVFVLAGSALLWALIALISPGTTSSVTWWNAAGTWLAMTVFYGSTDLMVGPIMTRISKEPLPFSPLRIAAAISLLLTPILVAHALTGDPGLLAGAAWGWGAALLLASEGVTLISAPGGPSVSGRARDYGLPLLLVSLPGMGLGLLTAPSAEARLGYFLGSAAILTGLSIRRLRWPVWSLGLAAWTGAYLTLFALPAVAALNVFIGFILVAPMAIYLTLELLMRRRLGLGRGWTIPVLAAGLLFAAATASVTIFSFGSEPGRVAITYLVVAVFLTVYAVLDGWALFWIGALVAAYIAYWAGVASIKGISAPLGWAYLPPGLVYLAIYSLARRRLKLSARWWLPALCMGGLAALADIGLGLAELSQYAGTLALILLVWSAVLCLLAAADREPMWWWGGAGLSYAAFVAGVYASKGLTAPLYWVYLPPGLVYLAIYTVMRRLRLGQSWWLAALVMGGLAALIDITLVFDQRGGLAEAIALLLLVWAAAAAVLTLLDSEKAWWWAVTLTLAYGSYAAATQIDAVRALPVFAGFVHLLPMLLFLVVDLLVTLRFRGGLRWRLPPLALAAVAGVVTVIFTTPGAGDLPARGIAVYGIMTVFLIVYAALVVRDAPAYLAALSGAAAFTYVITPWHSPDVNWAGLYTFLAVGYYALGLALSELVGGAPSWLRTLGRAFYWSGLALGAAASVAAFILPASAVAVIGVALAATCVVVEAFRRRNVWLGYPANALYLASYFMALRALAVSEPQFFTVGAALLGLIMHYLMSRRGNRGAAFTTGLISQLLLQSTNYIQMAATQDLKFFAALFFESLAVMIYGVVIRSRSLLFIPIGFLILGTGTVAFTFLKVLSTAAIIGVTGVVLLLLGILALVMRERLAHLVAILNTWEP